MNAHLWNKAARLFGGIIVLLAILTFVLFLHSTAPTAPTPPAAVATTQHLHPNRDVSGVSTPYPCGPDVGYSCTPGYTGTNATGWAWSYYGCPNYASGCTAGTPHNCTLYVSYRLMLNGVKDPGWYDNANNWANQANSHHVPVDQIPAVGAIAQWNSGIGHVAYVEASDASGITITMDDYYTG